MNQQQQTLVKLLSAAIRKNKTQLDISAVEWDVLYKEAKAHQVHTLLYPLIKELFENGNGPDSKLMADWKNDSFFGGIIQVQHIENMCLLIKRFHKESIPIILLKGLVLRDLYPKSELRTMSDADILVKEYDFDQAKQVLLDEGYLEHSKDTKHISFVKGGMLPIELHHKLAKGHFSTYAPIWEGKLWENAKTACINGVPALSLSVEDQIVHLCLHMAGHFLSGGFGLRQLCDLVVMIESNICNIDWNLLLKHLKEFEIYNFTAAIFLVCKKLLDLDKPDFVNNIIVDDRRINLLIDDILSAGIFGRASLDRAVSVLLVDDINNRKIDAIPGKFKRFAAFMFPPSKKLGNKYSYARRYPFLTPVAWIHRFVYSWLRKDLSISNKSAFFYSIASQKNCDERYELLQWLDML